MDIPIELLVFFVLGFVVVVWFVWFTLTGWINKWRYKPENDKGKKAEDHRKELLRRGKQEPSFKIAGLPGSDGPGKERGILQTAGSHALRENVSSMGKSSRRPRGIFKLRRRK